jgi:hypothetical protein
MALVREAIRVADVSADTDVEFYEFDREDIKALGEEDPVFLAAVFRCKCAPPTPRSARCTASRSGVG